MKFILTSTSGRMYDIPTTEETIVRVVTDRWGNERNVERISNICEVNSIEDLMNMVDKVNNEIDNEKGYDKRYHIDGIIFGRCWFSEDEWELEIYDGYRE